MQNYGKKQNGPKKNEESEIGREEQKMERVTDDKSIKIEKSNKNSDDDEEKREKKTDFFFDMVDYKFSLCVLH